MDTQTGDGAGQQVHQELPLPLRLPRCSAGPLCGASEGSQEAEARTGDDGQEGDCEGGGGEEDLEPSGGLALGKGTASSPESPCGPPGGWGHSPGLRTANVSPGSSARRVTRVGWGGGGGGETRPAQGAGPCGQQCSVLRRANSDP